MTPAVPPTGWRGRRATYLGSECEIRFRTCGFPGILRGHLEPRLATLPESQPCRNQFAPLGSSPILPASPRLAPLPLAQGPLDRAAGVAIRDRPALVDALLALRQPQLDLDATG